MNLTGKTALITGSTKGIGRAIAEKFSENGCKVAITGIEEMSEIEKAAQEIMKKTGNQVIGLKMDVSSEDDIINAIDKFVKIFNKIDILVNNAGIQIISPLKDFELSNWNKLIGIHLTGSYMASKACMNHMIEAGNGGKIIIIGSVHSMCASVNKAAYVAAKHGQVGLMKSLAIEGGEYDISANMVAPGYVWTDLVKKQIPELAKAEKITEEEVKSSMLKYTVDNKFATLDEVADTTLFFASFEGNALTGQSLIVSHGWNMK
ncbi:MAG: SDR family oxidoreductase [bacterium]|nr:SDR family oxidoreductase [bacterium]